VTKDIAVPSFLPIVKLRFLKTLTFCSCLEAWIKNVLTIRQVINTLLMRFNVTFCIIDEDIQWSDKYSEIDVIEI
jgi:hypothetical protein